MSDVFGEATVRISPSLTGFKTQLEKDLKKIMGDIKPPVIRVKPGLTRDFVGDLRRQVNAAVVQAQAKVRPVIIKTVLEIPSRRALASLVQAPVSLGTVTGHIAPGAGVSKEVAADQERINDAMSRGAVLLGGVQEAEEKVTKTRQNGGKVAKDSMSLAERTAKANKVAAGIQQTLNEREFKAATATGELAQEKKKLAIADKAVADATANRRFQLTAETKAVQEAAIAARLLHFERVKELEDLARSGRTVAGAATGAGTTAAQKDLIATSRKSADATKGVVAGLRETDAIAKSLGGSTADLAAQQALLKTQSKLLATANKNVTASLATENQVVRQTALSAQQAAQAQVNSTNQQIEAIKRLQAAERAHTASRTAQARANAAEASAGRRRSEQLSRGGQASILSLAGIRGATLAASRSFLVGAAAITVFARAVKQFADLERNLHVFAATTSATADQMEAVRREATELGADLTLPAVSAGDAAGAMVELAKAGLTVQDSIDGARAVLELSTAAAIDNADAVRLVANVLNAFSLAGRDATEVADTLANAANAAQGSIADIGTAFQQAATAGHQVGLSFQDTATFLTILAKNGIRGSDAGTSLRTALIRLVNPSKAAKEQFEKLGLVLRDAQGNLRPDIFLQIADATRRLGPAQRDATIALIGGQDAFRAVTILGRQSADSFLAMRAALRVEGTAAELAAARTEGLHGAMDGLQSVLETVGTNVASHVGPALADFVHTVSSGITSLSESEAVADALNSTLEASANAFTVLGAAIKGVGAVAVPVANALLQITNNIGVSAILAGAVAFKVLNAAMDGAILRMRILRPLFGIIATARIGAALSTGATAASVALGLLGKQAKATALPTATLGIGLGRVQTALAGTAVKTTAFRGAMAAIGPALASAATSGNALVIAITAVTAALVFGATREEEQERTMRKLREETEKLALAYDRVTEARTSLTSADRAAQQGTTGIEQAQLNLLNAQTALGQSDAGPASAERRQLLLSVRVAQQDLTFATEDYKKSLDELAIAREAVTAAEKTANQERGKARKALQDQIDESIKLANIVVDNNFVAKGIGVERVARLQLINILRKQATEEADSENATTRAIATRKRLVAILLQESKLPNVDIVPSLKKIFSAESLDAGLRTAAPLFGLKGKEAADNFIANVKKGMESGLNLGQAIKTALATARGEAEPTAVEAGAAHASAYEHGFGQAMTTVVADAIANSMKAALSGATKLALLAVKGASSEIQLAQARETERIATSVRQRAEAKFAADPNKKNQDFLDRAIKAEEAAEADVQRLLGDIESAQKDTASKIKDAQEKRDQAGQEQVDAVLRGSRATALQRAITTAGLTQWLGDDLKTTQAWLNYLKGLAKTLPARLKAAGASAKIIREATKALSALIFDVTNDIIKLNQDIADNTKARHEALQAILMERFELRISIAQAREDVAAELRVRRQKLEAITKELVRVRRTLGKNSIEWLRLKAAQVEEIARIRELNKELDKKKNVDAEFAFKFLQTQAGFAANLFGNLIPGFATAGLVGGGGNFPQSGGGTGPGGGPVSGPQVPSLFPPSPFEHGRGRGGVAGKRPDQALAAQTVTVAGGPTKNGQTRELKILGDILAVLHNIQRGTSHPSAQHVRRVGGGNGSRSDGVGGG